MNRRELVLVLVMAAGGVASGVLLLLAVDAGAWQAAVIYTLLLFLAVVAITRISTRREQLP